MKVKLPEYLGTQRGYLHATCSICGALVADRERHDSFHASLARLLGLEQD